MSSQDTADLGPSSGGGAAAAVVPPNSAYCEPGHYKNSVILASGGYDHTIRYWNAEKGFCERIIQQTDNSHVSSTLIPKPIIKTNLCLSVKHRSTLSL